MNEKGCCHIPHELLDWITFLAQCLPTRSIRTFIELLLRVMLSPSGFVTEAYLILDMHNHWTSYLKTDHHLGRNYLKGVQVDKLNALLSGSGYNFRLLLKWFRLLFAHYSHELLA